MKTIIGDYMKLKDRIKTYNFWVSLSSAVFLLLKLLGHQFNFYVDENIFSDLITSLCGILVILGIIVPPTSKTTNTSIINDNNFVDLNNQNLKTEEIKTLEKTQETVDETIVVDEAIVINEDDSIESAKTEENIKIDFDESNEISLESNLNNIESNENFDIELKSKVMKNLADQENLFEGKLNEYVEILQNEINLIKNK